MTNGSSLGETPMRVVFGIVAALIIEEFIKNSSQALQTNFWANFWQILLAAWWLFYIIYGTFVALLHPENKSNNSGTFLKTLLWRFIEFLSFIFLYDIAVISGNLTEVSGIARFSFDIFCICFLWILWKLLKSNSQYDCNKKSLEIVGLVFPLVVFLGVWWATGNECLWIICTGKPFNPCLAYVLMYLSTLKCVWINTIVFD